jgi:hypothetical protein
MEFPNGWGELRDLADLPLWRKLLIVSIIGLWLFLGIRHLSKEADIYVSAPHAPVIETKQVYPVHVNHGYLRYVTKREAENWGFLSTTTGPIVGVLALTMALVLVTVRYPRAS